MTDPVLMVHQTISINADLIERLENLLDIAREGKLQSFAYVGEITKDSALSGYSIPKKSNHLVILGLIDRLKFDILEDYND